MCFFSVVSLALFGLFVGGVVGFAGREGLLMPFLFLGLVHVHMQAKSHVNRSLKHYLHKCALMSIVNETQQLDAVDDFI